MDTWLAWTTNRIEEFASQWMAAGANTPRWGALTPADVAVAVFYLILSAVAAGAAGVFVTRRSKRRPTSDRAPDWRHHVVAAIGKPLYVLICVYGIYLAASPLLMRLKPDAGLSLLRGLMDLVFDLGAFAALFWFLFRATYVVESRLSKWALATPSKIDDLLVPLLGTTLRVVVVVVAIILALPMLRLPVQSANIIGKLTSASLIFAIALLAFRAVSICQRVVLTRFDIKAADNLRARQVYTQVYLICRIVYVMIGLFAAAAILMLFQQVRHVGTSLLASAGIVGIIAGFAAQKTLANLFAGFQIAFAQPVRQDDVVVVEGEWGRVEEITLTYVVVHLWDDRRLVLPLSYFIEKPFQNWTRTSSALMGSIVIWVDYSFPVDAGRKELAEIIETSALWDKRFWNLQVSDASEHSMQLRILATSADSSKSWDFRCEIREKFIAFIQRNHPAALPRFRAEFFRRRSAGEETAG